MNELELHIGKHYRDDDGWEVYVDHPEGGCVTLFRGTEPECAEFVRTAGPTTTLRELFGPIMEKP